MSTDQTPVSQKTLAQMTAEVVENNTAKGWYENPVMFPEAMAMLHSEVSEALEAWRKWGLDDVTDVCKHLGPAYGSMDVCKPEGVGSEFADIFIRLLDDAWIFGELDLEAAKTDPGRFGVNASFPANMNTLHVLIVRASMAQELGWDDEDARNIEHEFGNILIFLRQLCEKYGIDLLAEYERKMQFNRSRPYRHGNKRI